ncbi:hypothetical protein [Paenibacillus pini]|uniref:Uncharacterized protein n=1 Tax=Paenibacillus pini JCM 16418 TaxID=1236976 RepID=W7YDN9_9BACL|nr:hypothetical protein [Paenibacillus pini]GAF06562.1 hypothetical protein JCM16418_524 [Paenibacillus pini JCM 16418]
MKNRKLLKFLIPILIVFLILFAIDYSGKVAKEKRYEQYKTEPASIESIALWNDWNKTLVSTSESVNFSFKKEWIPKDKDHIVEINQILKTVGDTTIIIDKTYRHVFQDDDDVVMMFRFEQNTKKLQGKFITSMTFENTGMIYSLNWAEIPKSFSFEHGGQKIEVKSYSHGHGEDDLTFGIPISILEQFDFQIDVLYTGLALYEYRYIGD